MVNSIKCPHCKKKFTIKEPKPYDHPIVGEGFIKTFIVNFFLYMVVFGGVITYLDNHTNIPLSMQDGLSFNLGVALMLPVAVILLMYVGLYRYKKLKGWLLITDGY